jgi:hypothetical protein
VEVALEVDLFLGKEAPQQWDLLVEDPAAIRVGNPERGVLHVVPARADAQPQAALGEQLHLDRLLGHQRGLPLRQDDDAGCQLDALGHPRQVCEERERLVERILLGVGAPECRIAARVLRAQHVIKREDVRVTEGLGGLCPVADRRDVIADLGGWKDCADLHAASFPTRYHRPGRACMMTPRPQPRRRIAWPLIRPAAC